MSRQKDGYIKLYRSILNKNYSPTEFKIWVGLLLLANPPTAKDAGLVDLSEREIVELLGVGLGSVERAKELFIKEKQVEEVKIPSKTRPIKAIRIINFGKYQDKPLVKKDKEIVPPEIQSPEKDCTTTDTKIVPKNGQIVPPEKLSQGEIVPKNGQIVPKNGQIVPPEIQSHAQDFFPPHTPPIYNKANKVNKVYIYSENLGEKYISFKNGKVLKIPHSVKEETLDAFIEMRKKIKSPITEYGINLLFKELEKFEKQGENPEELLNKSILNSWKGVWSLKSKGPYKVPPAAKSGYHDPKNADIKVIDGSAMDWEDDESP